MPSIASRLSRPLRLFAVTAAIACAAGTVTAQPLVVNADDSIEKLLAAQKGKRVTVKLGPNDELTGVVRSVSPNVVHLGELAGRELFDAAVDVRQVRAVIVRTKN
jgi:hypothetical protein